MRTLPLALALVLTCATAPAGAAAPEWFGFARSGVTASNGAESWVNGGLGRYLAADDESTVDLDAQFALLWEPSLEWRLFAQALVRGDGAGHGRHAGLVEAYGERSFFLADDSRLRLRAGQFFLPSSREAVDPLWQSRYTLSLSALNSWIAEEVRPIGLDVSWRNTADSAREWELAATAFGGNDSAGALLAWRGFAQHDRLSVLGEVLSLPDLPTLANGAEFGHQRDDGSKPFGPDLDDRVGVALRARFGVPQRFRLLAGGFDNRGDRDLHRGEYAWRTRFIQLGGEWSPDERWTFAAEWMDGDSGMGFAPGPRVDIDFASAYLLASFAPDTRWRYSARFERFEIEDRDGVAEDNGEDGRTLTLAVLCSIGEHWRFGLEWLHGDSAHHAADLLAQSRETGGRQWRFELRRSF
jgi:hypothetical protein